MPSLGPASSAGLILFSFCVRQSENRQNRSGNAAKAILNYIYVEDAPVHLDEMMYFVYRMTSFADNPFKITHARGGTMSKKPSCLLPDDVQFQHYDLELTPNFADFTFKGIVKITCNVLRPVREIVLHAVDLHIQPEGVNLTCQSRYGRELQVHPESVIFDVEQEMVTISFEDEIPEGIAHLAIRYSGVLGDKMAGFYRSKYIAPDGTEKYLAVTQCAATDARRVLPCGDEPALKASFKTALIVPNGMTALSNMPKHRDIDRKDGAHEIRFGVTPKMSTYLFACVVGELDFVETTTKTGTLIRVYTVPGKSEQGRFALETARRALEFYNEYFGTPYPLPKLDLVAVPDFAAAAMENWGLVMFKENALLIDPKNSSAKAYQWVAEVVDHELAHMWVGNLVTMQQWSQLWLNEGFATWMGTYVSNALFPEWDILTQFVSGEYASALALDGLRSSHPIEVAVEHPDEISQLFDDISYSKGASVVRMIHQALGDEAFRRGLHIYLKRHAYGNATTEDLWAALAEASGKPVAALMNSWTKQAGYPLVTFGLDVDGDHSHEVHYQERFLASGAQLTTEESAQAWQLPATFFSNGGESYKYNPGQTTIARVNYPPAYWKHLATDVREGNISPIDRYGLASDALALTRAGHMSTTDMLNFITAYKDETSYTVWSAVLETLAEVHGLVEETADRPRLEKFALKILGRIAGIVRHHEAPNESHTNQLLRDVILDAYELYGSQATTEWALDVFRNHISGWKPLNPNLRGAVYNIVARLNLGSLHRELQQRYEKAELHEERVRLLNALGHVSDDEMMSDLLDYTFNSGKVRTGDVPEVLSSLGSHAAGRRAAWHFVRTNWGNVQERYSGGGLMMTGRILEATLGGFATAKDADEIEQFFIEHPTPSATRVIAEALEQIRDRAAWYERDGASLTQFLQSY